MEIQEYFLGWGSHGDWLATPLSFFSFSGGRTMDYGP